MFDSSVNLQDSQYSKGGGTLVCIKFVDDSNCSYRHNVKGLVHEGDVLTLLKFGNDMYASIWQMAVLCHILPPVPHQGGEGHPQCGSPTNVRSSF